MWLGEVFSQLLNAYLYLIGSIYLIGVGLIFCNKDWGVLASWYIDAVVWIQDKLLKLRSQHALELIGPTSACDLTNDSDNEEHADVFEPCSGSESGADSYASSFELVQPTSASPNIFPFEIAINLSRQGIESIAREDVGSGFVLAPDYTRYELNPLRLPKHKHSTSFNLSHTRWQRHWLVALLYASLAFRLCTLFPIRCAFITASLFTLIACCVWNVLRPLSARVKTRIAVIYSKLYTAGCGFIVRFEGQEYRPKRPGVICANHLSPNDVHVMFGDIPLDQEHLYLVTGQKHRGFIWVLENLVDKVCPALWLERADAESRRQFSVQVVEAARVSGPVLLFPEGYCTNNALVLQFRRAVFQEGVTVYPVAIKQEPRFGDSYWSENNFLHYLFRVLTSWAIVYNVYYLAPQHRRANETSSDFAARVQRLIAARIGVRAVDYDGGGLWYKAAEREKALAKWQEILAIELVERQQPQEDEGSTTTDGEDTIGEEDHAVVAKVDTEMHRKRTLSVSGRESVALAVSIVVEGAAADAEGRGTDSEMDLIG